MGAVNTYEYGFGKDVKEAFRDACDQAEIMYGIDPYNGQINNCHLIGLVKPPHRYGTKLYDQWEEKQIDNLSKRECKAIEVTGKLAIELKKNNGYARTRKKVYHFFGLAPD